MNENMWKKRYFIRLIIGSLLFGFVVFGNEIFKNGNFNIKGLAWVAYGCLGFGIVFHILFSFIINTIKKKGEED